MHDTIFVDYILTNNRVGKIRIHSHAGRQDKGQVCPTTHYKASQHTRKGSRRNVLFHEVFHTRIVVGSKNTAHFGGIRYAGTARVLWNTQQKKI
jgi:hypothetical protein